MSLPLYITAKFRDAKSGSRPQHHKELTRTPAADGASYMDSYYKGTHARGPYYPSHDRITISGPADSIDRLDHTWTKTHSLVVKISFSRCWNFLTEMSKK